MPRDDFGCLSEPLGGLELTLGVDDLRAPLTFCFGLTSHHALHVRGYVDVFDLNARHLHTPRLGGVVDDALKIDRQLVG